MANEEIKSLAVKLAIEDGSFQQGVTNLKQGINVINSEFKASVAGVKDWGKNLDSLKANATALGEKISIQKDIIKTYEQQLQKSQDTLGKNSEKMMELKKSVETARLAWEKSREELGANDEATLKLKEEYQDLSKACKSQEDVVIKSNTSVKNYTTDVNNAKGALNGMESELKKTNSDIENFDENSKRASSSAQKLAGDINDKITGGLKKLTLGFTAAVAGMSALFFKTTENADQIQTAADVYGMTAERIQELTYVGKKLDVELDTITKAQQLLTKNMYLAKDGTGAQAEAFNELKVSVVDSNGKLKDAKDVMGEAIDKLGLMANETERDALAQKIFGKSAMELNPLIKAGSAEIANLTDEAHKSGAVMSNETVAGLDKFGDSVEGIKLSIKGMIGSALSPIVPKLQEMADRFKNMNTKPFTDAIGWIIDNGSTIIKVLVGGAAALVSWKIATAAVLVVQIAHNAQLIVSAALHGGQAAAVTAATNAQWGLNAAMAANPIGLVITAVIALIAIIGSLMSKQKSAAAAAKEAAEAEIKAAEEARQKIIEENRKIYESKRTELESKISAEDAYYEKQKTLAQKEFDDELQKGQKKLDNLKKNLSERQSLEDKRHNEVITAIQEEYGVFEEKQKSKTELLQNEYSEKSNTIAEMLTLSQTAATQETEAFNKSSEDILTKAQEIHNEKISMYSEEYLLSLGIINEKLSDEVKKYQDEISIIKNKTDEENALIKKQADNEKLIDLQKKVDSAKTNDEILAAKAALQTEINRQNREKLLEQRNDDIESLNQKIKDANTKATEEKSTLLQNLKDKIAAEQVEIKKNIDYNISEVQRERKEKETEENKKYEASKNTLDKESIYLDTWLDTYKLKLENKLDTELDNEKERHDQILKDYAEELEAAVPATAIIKTLKKVRNDLNNPFSEATLETVAKAKEDAKKIGLPEPTSADIASIIERTKKNIDAKIDEQKKILHDVGIPGFAKGVTNFEGGPARINEQGGEIVNFPRGTNIIPHDISMQIARSVGEAVGSRNTVSRPELHLHLSVGTLVGSDGMTELSNIISRNIGREFGLATSGNY